MWEDVGKLVTVPNVVGLPFHVGRDLAMEHGVTLANPDPDGPPIGALAWSGLFYIRSQQPSAGAIVSRHSSVAVEVVPDGGAVDDVAIRTLPDQPPADAAHATPEHEHIIRLGEDPPSA